MALAYAPHKIARDHVRPSMPAFEYQEADGRSGDGTELSHPLWLGYLFWIFGFTGAHRFYYGRPLTGALWFFTFGLFMVGWIVDLFLIPAMAETASRRFPAGRYDYSIAWMLQMFLGVFGIHRFYLGKIITGVIWLCTGGLFGVGYIYDMFTLNEQIDQENWHS